MKLIKTIEQKKKYICLINAIPSDSQDLRLLKIKNYLVNRLNKLIRRESNQVQLFLGNYFGREVNIETIQEKVSDYFNITVEQMNQKSRKTEFVQARQISMYFCKIICNKSLETIGNAHNRNHATVIHSIKVINRLLFNDKETIRNINELSLFFGVKSEL